MQAVSELGQKNKGQVAEMTLWVQFCTNTSDMFKLKQLPMWWGAVVMASLLKEVNKNNSATESRGRHSSVSEPYLWRYLKSPFWKGPLLSSVEWYRVFLCRGKGLCQTLEWGEGLIATLHCSADLSTGSFQSKETLLKMLVFNQSVVLNQWPEIHSFPSSSVLAQDQWRLQESHSSSSSPVQLKWGWGGGVSERKYFTLMFDSGLVQLWVFFSEILIITPLEKKKTVFCNIMTQIAAREILVQVWVMITAAKNFGQGSLTDYTIGQWARW